MNDYACICINCGYIILFDLELDAQVARAEAELDEDLRARYREGDELMTERRMVFTVFDDGKRERTPARSGQSEFAAKLGPPRLDADLVPWRVVRERHGR